MSPVPGGPGHPKKPKRTRPPRPPRSPHDGGGGSGGSPSTNGGGGSHSPYRPGTGQHPPRQPASGGGSHSPYRPGTPFKPPKPPAWVVRRQQLLRRAGYNVAVDGVWGAQSQAAWAAFTGRIRHAPVGPANRTGPPPGMVYHNGVLMTTKQASTAAAIERGQANARAIFNRAKIGQLVHDAQRRAASTQAAIQQPTRSFGSPDAAAARVGNTVQRALEREAIQQHQQGVTERVNNILGGAGGYGWKDPLRLVHAAQRGSLDPHNLAFLMSEGVIDVRRQEDVRAIQVAVNKLPDTKHKIKVDGVFGAETAHAIENAWSHQAARDWHDQVAQTRKTLYDTGIAQRVLSHLNFGVVLTPAQLTNLLQSGGPGARRIAKALGDAVRERTESAAFDTLQRDRANQLGLLPVGPFKPSHTSVLFALLAGGGAPDQILASSTNARQYLQRMIRYIHEQERLQAQQLHHSGGGGILSDGLHYVDAALSWSGRQVRPVGLTVIQAYRAAQAKGVRANNDIADWLNAHGIPAPYQDASGNVVGRRDAARGSMSWDTAWQQGAINYQDLHGGDKLLFDIATDPLTYVGTGVYRWGAKLAFSKSAIGAFHTLDQLSHLEPIIGSTAARTLAEQAVIQNANLATFGEHLSEFRAFTAARGSLTHFLEGRFPDAYAKATATRAAAYAAARRTARHAIITSTSGIIRGAGKLNLEGAAADAAKRADEVAKLIDPALLDQVIAASADHADALTNAAPSLMRDLGKLPISLYAHIDRKGGILSIAGRRFEARFLNAARVSILARFEMLDRLAAHLPNGVIPGDLESLPFEQLSQVFRTHVGEDAYQAVIKSARTTTHGAIPLAWRDAYFSELRMATDRLHNAILPALDDQVRLRLGNAIWHTDGTLLHEGSSLVRDRLAEFFGHAIEDAYQRVIRVTNPFYNKAVQRAERNNLMSDEIRQRANSAHSFAEMMTRIEGPAKADHWLAWAKTEEDKITQAVTDAWQPIKGRAGWFKDTRRYLEIPAAVADDLVGSLAHTELGNLATATVDAGRLVQQATPNPIATTLAEQAVLDAANASVDGQKWMTLADHTLRLEALHAAVHSGAIGKAFRDNWLILPYLKHHQWLPLRINSKLAEAGLQFWKTMVLPLRLGFYVFNRADNWIKMLMRGCIDPRLYINPDGLTLLEVFPTRVMLAAIKHFDEMAGTDLRTHAERWLNAIWDWPPLHLDQLFGVHGINPPAEFYDAARTIASLRDPIGDLEWAPSLSAVSDQTFLKAAERQQRLLPDAAHDWYDASRFKSLNDYVKKGTDVMWEITASHPENRAKRGLFVHAFQTGIDQGLDRKAAWDRAIAEVHHTLFDYDNITAAEDSLRIFFPFIRYGEKNVRFWATEAARAPGIFATGQKLDDYHDWTNRDQPPGLRRYYSLAPIGGLIETVPGLSGVGSWFKDQHVDPLNISSMYLLYKTLQEGPSNPLLPGDKQGSWGVVSTLLNAFQQTGFSFNPYLLDFGRRMGWLDQRAWQDVFPQTTLIQALSDQDWIRETLGVDSRNGFNLEDYFGDPLMEWTFGRIPGVKVSGTAEASRINFDQIVKQEMAFQAMRGEPVDQAAAEAKARKMFLVSSIFGYATGLFPRTITPESRALMALSEQRANLLGTTGQTDQQRRDAMRGFWGNLTDDQEKALRLWNERYKTGVTPQSLQNLAEAITGAQTYSRISDYQERQDFLRQNPDVAQLVNPILGGRTATELFLRDWLLSADTEAVMSFTNHYLKGIDAAYDVRQGAYNHLVTPTLRKFWAQNDTTAEQRQRHIDGAYFHYITRIDQTYRAIPETDYQARQEFLDSNPLLRDWWAAHDGMTDDFRSILNQANSTFRDIYFHFVDHGDWDSADEFLRRHPFIFDFTSAEGRISPDGKWIPKSEQQRDYAKIAPLLRVWTNLPERDRHGYLDTHPLLAAFFRKYGARGTSIYTAAPSYQPGGLTEHARDYLAIKALLDRFFALTGSAREAYLNAHPELRRYFAKYAHERGQSQHAQDYLAVKPLLDQFFSLPQAERKAYLARHPQLQAYFDKYGTGRNAHTAHDYHAALREGLAENPDIATRYHFWQQFYALPPNQRIAFVHKHAAAAGIFIYGSLSYDARQREEANWHRLAVRHGQTDKQYLYLRVAPLLDLYFKLPKGGGERALFLQMNPEVQTYFQRYGAPIVGDPKTAALVERYFQLPAFSQSRVTFLRDHPELRVYFNKDATPRELAMQRQIEGYFQLPYGPKRDDYLLRHPEVKLYFDQRAAEHALFSSLAAAFNATDPRMKRFYEMYADIIPLDAMRLYWLRAQSKHEATLAGTRGDRQPGTAADALTRRDRAGTDPTLS